MFERERSSEAEVVNLLRNTGVVLDEFRFTQGLSLDDNVPDIQYTAASLTIENASVLSAWSDHQVWRFANIDTMGAA